MTDEDFDRAENLFSLQLKPSLRRQVRHYFQLLLRWNRHINLTRVLDPWDALRFHFMEAFWAAELFGKEIESPLGDIGSGAGFPGMALKLYRPDLDLVLMEKNQGKTVFLREVSRELDLVGVQIFDQPGERFEGWNRLRTASIRALKPSSEILALLAENQVSLLAFHGGDAEFSYKTCHQEMVPHSRNRFVSLLRFT